jgi:hypothetical protein
MMIRAITIASVMSLGLTVGYAQAETSSVATLTQVGGKVMVNKGKGFVAAKSGMALAETDRLITLDGSSASVVFADGCVNNVKANSVLAVSAGCKAQAMSVNSSMPMRYAQTGGTQNDAGSGGGGGGSLLDTKTLGILGGAAIVGCLITCDNDDDNNISGQ